MARSLDRSVRFTGSSGAVLNMLVVLGLVGGIAWYLSPWSPQPNGLLITAFMANPYLNGLILFVLFIGIMYNLRQAMLVGPAVSWINAFRNSVDPSRTRLPRAPMLITAVSRMLLDADERGGRLSQASTRAILDSVGLRIDEGREIGRYATNLLVFLGLLGTFWGLLQTVNGVSEVIGSLAGTSDGNGSDAVGSLISNLNEPLSGMGTAFSSSLFGLGGSLVLGLLDIQSGQAQNRFYSDLEDWLSGITDTTTAKGEGSAATYSDEDIAGALGRLEAAINRLSQGNEHGTQVVQQEIRQLGRTLLEGKKPGGR
ncbi:MAG: flagellar motor protein MotA [Pseudomonadota bacterium]